MRKLIHNTLNKVLIIGFLLLTLVGQAFAYVSFTCNMQMEQKVATEQLTSSHQQMSHHDMPHHEMSHEQESMTMHLDCCGEDCLCPISACANQLLLINDNLVSVVDNTGLVKSSFISQLPKQIKPSLFRPPISA